MARLVRTNRGSYIDFELLAIKQQLASSPVPKAVEERKQAIAEKDGVRSNVAPDVDFLAISAEAAQTSSRVGAEAKKK